MRKCNFVNYDLP